MIEPLPNIRLGVLRAIRSKLDAEIRTHDMNLEILLCHSVGIGEHSDITTEIEGWIRKIGEAKEAIAVIDTKLGE